VVNGGVTSYESTISYTYDAGDRITQIVDSAGGTITRGYDNLDRLATETTAQGSVSYGYDNRGRRTSMTVAGQSQVSYSYDNADRLTQISQGSSNVGFGYDNANRRTSLTLANGVSVSYSFDNDSRVTGITYQLGTTTLGNLTYSYDRLGQRMQVGGSFARTALPGAVSTTAYDAADELTNWNGAAISYDANGNMLSDGSNAFTWNARNQVATLNAASLQYDALGRRIKNAAGTSFLFDGPNAVQELAGSNVTANLLQGGGVDKIFTRTDSAGSRALLRDALGSTVALVDAGGNVQTDYSYDPFGNTSSSGQSSSNVFQYIGRENEGNGLYFVRARYYSPTLHRFVSEDPLRFFADSNFYRYCFDSPTNCTDRVGLQGGPGEEDEEEVEAPENFAEAVLGKDAVDAIRNANEEAEAEAEAEAAREPEFEKILDNISEADQMAIARGDCPTNPEVGRAIAIKKMFQNLRNPLRNIFNQKAPNQVAPGTNQLSGVYINDLGRAEPWIAYYDGYGRIIARTDYNAGNSAAGIPGTHTETYEYGPGYSPYKTTNHIPGEYPH
jgi:RHS repeat-associated protein